LTIVSHDKFQEIVDYANSPDSVIRGGLKVVYVNDERSKVVIAEPEIVNRIAEAPAAFGLQGPRDSINCSSTSPRNGKQPR
jgi:hypothetical protein